MSVSNFKNMGFRNNFKGFDAFETPNIGVLINPLSGGNLNGLGSIRSVINDNPQVIHRDVQTPQDVLGALLDFARRDVDLLAVNGGDGTVQAVLTNLFLHQPFSTMPLLAVLQSGTTSMTPGTWGLQDPALNLCRNCLNGPLPGTVNQR
jgi:diacylglycerol kinase (ATP)